MKWRLRPPERWLHYVLALAIALLCVTAIVGDRGLLHLARLQSEKQRLDEQNYRLQKENESLQRQIARLRRDDSYLEQVAREELNLVRPGEIIYRFRPRPPSRERERSVNAALPESLPSTVQRERP
ncbi:MAG TPA: septum formation initiator family protein [Candidatus Eisenbacteria bacterium]|nr:septum formation initiator family protein [Candidatus Eisenbacteria bacterium]